MITLYIVLSILVAVSLILLFNTIRFKPIISNGAEESFGSDIDSDICIKKLQEAVKIKTISYDDYDLTDWKEFDRYHSFIKNAFPLVHANMDLEIINKYSLLYRWKSGNESVKPIMITAHMDVVPVEDGTEDDWTHPAFDGVIDGEYLWGRGTLDTKAHMIAALEAAEQAISKGLSPNRDIYFAFGHDEEVGGTQGATKIASYLEEKGLEFDFILDEGGTVLDGLLEDIDKPIALIGIGEKGYANIKVTVTGDGGHSAMPPKHTALGLLSDVITNIENKQCKLVLTPPIHEFLMRLGPEMKLTNRVILSNLWLFKPLFMKVFSNTKTGNAMLRTTTAVTMSEASVVPNVLPQNASVTCNFRIIPGEDCDTLISHIKEINKGIDIEIDGLRLENPSKISPVDTEAFRLIENNIKTIYNDAIVTPYLVLAGTDARKYEGVCDNIYRFTPYFINNQEMESIHNTNERISLDNIEKCLIFFTNLFIQH